MTTFRPASAVQRIADALIPKHHPDLADVRIEYVFRDPPSKSAGKIVWGKTRKIGGLNAYLASHVPMSDVSGDEDFFVIEIAEAVWASLNDPARTALVGHELCHCYLEFDEEGESSLRLRSHDVEEFRAVIERHGLWRPEVEHFADAVMARRKSRKEMPGQVALLDEEALADKEERLAAQEAKGDDFYDSEGAS